MSLLRRQRKRHEPSFDWPNEYHNVYHSSTCLTDIKAHVNQMITKARRVAKRKFTPTTSNSLRDYSKPCGKNLWVTFSLCKEEDDMGRWPLDASQKLIFFLVSSKLIFTAFYVVFFGHFNQFVCICYLFHSTK